MDVKKHIGRWTLLLAALVVVCSATGRVLFASADGSLRGIHAEPGEVYLQATPTNSQILSVTEYRSASPTNSSIYAVEESAPCVTVRAVESNRFSESESPDVQVTSATPTNTQVLSASDYGMWEMEQQSMWQAFSPEYVTYLPVDISVTTAVEGTDNADGFFYTVEYIGCAGDDSLAPDVPPGNTAAVVGNGVGYFETIYFREPGQYYFKVCQDRVNNALNTDKGYFWNDTWYFVGVRVEEGLCGLEATLSYYEVGSGGMCIPRDGSALFTQICA